MITPSFSTIQIKEKPKICAIDIDKEIVEAIKAKGLHCFSCTLGSQIKVPNLNWQDTHYCLVNKSFPDNLHEYDIVLVDLKEREPVEYNKDDHTRSSFKGNEQTILSSSYPATIFDPRPLLSYVLGQALQSFFRKETLIIVFCSAQEIVEYHPITITRNDSREGNPIKRALYEFIPCLNGIYNKIGKNVFVSDIREDLKLFLQRYSSKFIYEVVFEHPTEWSSEKREQIKLEEFFPVFLNSDDEVIGFVDSRLYPSTIFAFPQLEDSKKDFLIELIDEMLPSLFPQIFPYSDQFSWLNSENYFLPNQADILEKKESLEIEYKTNLAALEEEFQQNQIKYQYLHDLITETSHLLVKSVQKLFVWLGFENVIDMDETNQRIKQEDLQIPLENGLLVIEVKGIGGTSTDSECSQIDKIKHRREKDRSSFDVFALYVVNHQRYLPPEGRKNPPFTEHQITDALSDERGLMTTYELFKLYFNIEHGYVTKEGARHSLLNYGLVKFEPSNARCLGCNLEVYYKGQVVVLTIDNLLVKKGQSIIVCNNNTWFTTEILEIQLDGKSVESACDGEIGLKLSHAVSKTDELWLKALEQN